jgi:transmembrane sensor
LASPVSSNSINDRAAEWAVEAAHGEMPPASRATLEAWLAADVRHRGAFIRAQAWLRATEDAVVGARPILARPRPHSGHGNVRQRHETARAKRNGRVRWGGRLVAASGALAACVLAAMMTGIPLLQTEHVPADQIVHFKDGSIAALGQGAKVEVAISDRIRRVTLLSGTATFTVAKDRARPFVVRSGDVYAEATGTVYAVSRVGPTGGTVKVVEGSVLVWARDVRDQAVLLQAGGSVTLDPGPRPLPSSSMSAAPQVPRLPPPDLAQISLDNVSVASAVTRFNRVNSTKIVLADPAFGEIRIIGLYRANDPERFAQAVAEISNGKVEHRAGSIVIESK